MEKKIISNVVTSINAAYDAAAAAGGHKLTAVCEAITSNKANEWEEKEQTELLEQFPVGPRRSEVSVLIVTAPMHPQVDRDVRAKNKALQDARQAATKEERKNLQPPVNFANAALAVHRELKKAGVKRYAKKFVEDYYTESAKKFQKQRAHAAAVAVDPREKIKKTMEGFTDWTGYDAVMAAIDAMVAPPKKTRAAEPAPPMEITPDNVGDLLKGWSDEQKQALLAGLILKK